jgi:hypothetical protein
MRIKAYRGTHIERLYQRLAPGKGHGRAVVAVARHLAEASYWVLRKRQPYKDPAPRPASTRRGLNRVRPGSAKRETRLTGTRSRGECGSRSAKAHAGCHGEYMIHDETT